MNAIVDPNQDTEFHDALRKHGIIPEKPPSRSPSPELSTASEQRQAALHNATLEELDRALEGEGGGGNDDEERILLQLRQQRLQALAKERARGRFGRVYPIARPDYTRQVTEASRASGGVDGEGSQDDDDDDDDDGRGETGAGTVYAQAKAAEGSAAAQSYGGAPKRKGTGVVCFLYKDSIPECRLLSGYLDHLAEKYPATKFVSIVGDQCIPNYPDKNLPTLLIYRNGELHRQIIGLRPEIGLDGMKTKCQDIELLLTAVGAIERSVIPGSSTHPNAARQHDEGSSGRGGDDDDDEEEEETRRRERQEAAQDEDEGFGGSNRTYAKPSVRSQEEDDDELDWDL